MKGTKELIEDTRKWLEKNKIFFETLVMVSLTIMSIVVGWNANKIADKANLLTEKEMELTHNEKMPKFTIEEDDNPSAYSILNVGGNISDATAVYDYFVCIKANYKERYKDIVIKVLDAYERMSVGYNYDTYSFNNKANDLLIHTMMEEVTELMTYFDVSLEYHIEEVVELAYTDYMDEMHIERYITDSSTKNYMKELSNERYNDLRTKILSYINGGVNKTEEMFDDSVSDIEVQILLALDVEERECN